MAKTDWQMGDTVQPEDMNQIGQEINQLREDVDNIEVPPASTEQAGIVQLSNAIDSISETMAATPKAVKQAYDQAVQAFQLGNEKKQDLVDALIAIGVPASTSESWDDLLGKVASVIRATGDASVGDVLSGKTFSNASANGLTGTMPNRGAVNPNLTNQGQQYTIPAGYHNGAGKVTANISNLTAGNVRSGATVGGVAGTFSQFSNGATAAQILTGRSAAVNGQVVNGTMADRAGNQPAQAVRARNNTILGLRPQNAGYYPAGTGNWLEWEEPNWKPENIVEGVQMFGKTGTAPKLSRQTAGRGLNYDEFDGTYFYIMLTSPNVVIEKYDLSGTRVYRATVTDWSPPDSDARPFCYNKYGILLGRWDSSNAPTNTFWIYDESGNLKHTINLPENHREKVSGEKTVFTMDGSRILYSDTTGGRAILVNLSGTLLSAVNNTNAFVDTKAALTFFDSMLIGGGTTLSYRISKGSNTFEALTPGANLILNSISRHIL